MLQEIEPQEGEVRICIYLFIYYYISLSIYASTLLKLMLQEIGLQEGEVRNE